MSSNNSRQLLYLDMWGIVHTRVSGSRGALIAHLEVVCAHVTNTPGVILCKQTTAGGIALPPWRGRPMMEEQTWDQIPSARRVQRRRVRDERRDVTWCFLYEVRHELICPVQPDTCLGNRGGGGRLYPQRHWSGSSAPV